MTELVFRGKFETQKVQELLDGINNLLKETDSQFRGEVHQFDIGDYAEYEEITTETALLNEESKES